MINVFWFRRDLRLEDNAGLFHALNSGNPVLAIFIFDKDILDLLEDKKDRRVEFIHLCLDDLERKLSQLGSSLWVFYGKPLDAFKKLVQDFQIQSVYTNRDYEPYAIQRDLEIADFLKGQSIHFEDYKDQVIFEKSEVLTDQNKVYTIFSPYAKKWHKNFSPKIYEAFDNESFFGNFYQTAAFDRIELTTMGFEASRTDYPNRKIKKDIVKNYGAQRNFPDIESTTRLGVHLRFGTISIRQVLREAIALQSESFVNELVWRDFYMMILYNFPSASTHAFKPAYEQITWRNNEQEFETWCAGQTGYPIVDAGMRELNTTGFMHNRVRMITASFLTKHLLIDWRWGEAYFAKKLLDFDLSANNGGWQWAAGSGCDAAPYFRVFNPMLQTKKFDPKLAYIKKWVPEINELSYPKPIVNHEFARKRALETYKTGLHG